MNKMFEEFEDLPDDYVPDNRHRHLYETPLNEIIIGGFSANYFCIDNINYKKECYNFELVYSQSPAENPVVIKNNNSFNVRIDYIEEYKHNYTKFIIKLTEEETSKFKINRDTYAQIKFFLNNGETFLTPVFKIKLIDSLFLTKETIANKIIRETDCSNSFIFKMDYEAECDNFLLTYTQKAEDKDEEVILIKNNNSAHTFERLEEEGVKYTKLTIFIPKTDTEKFVANKDTFAHLVFTLHSGKNIDVATYKIQVVEKEN